MLKRPILSTIVLSALCVLMATAAAAWAYQTFGRFRPGLAYQIVVTVIISSVLAPVFLFPIIVLVARLRVASGRLRTQAMTDALTGLPNTSALVEALSARLSKLAAGEGLAVHFVDLDRFKEVNDTLGHAAGDAVLKEVADRLTRVAGPSNFVGRFGGDEFVIIQCDARPEAEIIDLTRRTIAELSTKLIIDGHDVHVGATIGSSRAPDDGWEAAKLFQAADTALYRAKQDARGTHVFFDPGMEAEAQERRGIELDLREALPKDELGLDFQPLFQTASLRVSTCEALLRWHHPRRGLVPPDVLIPAAERVGNIVEIGRWVLMESCAACAAWPNSIGVAVNLSPVQFGHDNVVSTVDEALVRAGLAPERLELEITETVLLHDRPGTRRTLETLREWGVRISLDDFGTGYSGLDYINRFQLDKVKIDRRFVAKITSDQRSLVLLRGIAKLCADLGMVVAVEGVETPEQADLIAAVDDIHEVQGFLLCRPLPAQRLIEMLPITGMADADVRLARSQLARR